MKTSEPRLSLQTLKVLQLFCEHASKDLAGIEIGRATGLASGTLYPILARLERAGWLESHWESIEPSEAGRPRRRYYRITGTGQKKARQALQELHAPQWKEVWA